MHPGSRDCLQRMSGIGLIEHYRGDELDLPACAGSQLLARSLTGPGLAERLAGQRSHLVRADQTGLWKTGSQCAGLGGCQAQRQCGRQLSRACGLVDLGGGTVEWQSQTGQQFGAVARAGCENQRGRRAVRDLLLHVFDFAGACHYDARPFGRQAAGEALSIPHWIRASAAVAQEQVLEGLLEIASLPRLRDQADADQPLQVRLAAGRRHGEPDLNGQVRGTLKLDCQRCGAVYAWTLDLAFVLRLVDSDEAEKAVLEDADPLRVEDDRVLLHTLIEDEVLLALPMLPRCPTCEQAVQLTAPALVKEEAVRDNPFAALKNLKF